MKNILPISVIMPAFNAEKYIEEAIESILKQSFDEFEFIIIDDYSKDKTIDIINSYNDSRIKVIRNNKKIGNYPSRNKGFYLSKGKYICVMDSDDVSLPNRLKTQFELMEFNSDVGICGSNVEIIPQGFIPDRITDHELLKVAFLSNNFCSHPSLIIRRSLMDKYKLRYIEYFYYASDYDFCAKAMNYSIVANIPDVLLQYRQHSGQITIDKFNDQQKFADMIRINILKNSLRFKNKEIPILYHLKLMRKQPLALHEKEFINGWVSKIINRNNQIGYYEPNRLSIFLESLVISCFKQEII